jgi:Tfp pilus assembly protein PilF
VKAIEADPSAADAFYGKALVLSSMGHQESAVSYYRKLLIMKPHDSKFYIAFANYLLKLNIVE